MEIVNLGNTGLRVSRLCIGTGTNGWGGRSDQSHLGIKGLAELLRFGYDHGVTFWDSADQYGTHPHIAQALTDLDRSSVVIVTKTTSRTREDTERYIERFLRETGTDYIDILLLHCITNSDWSSYYNGAMEALSRAKERGLIRAHGVSIHDIGALRTAASNPWVDVVLARINYSGVNMDDKPERVVPVLEQMHSSGKGIYGMKVVGCGKLTHDLKRAFRYVLELSCVDSITIGVTSKQQLKQDIDLVEEFEQMNKGSKDYCHGGTEIRYNGT